jgi:hypothetical protein
MSDQRTPLSDAAIEAALARRAPRGADRELLESIMKNASRTSQAGGWISSPLAARSPRVYLAWAAIIAALLLVAAVAAVGIMNQRPSDLAVVVTPAPSATIVRQTPIASPSPSQTPSPSESTKPCLTDTLKVLTGARMPEAFGDAEPARLDQGIGVYWRNPTFGGNTELWAVRGGEGPAKRVAAVAGRLMVRDVLDVSPDGSTALIRVGAFSHSGLECADLYSVRLDGGGATRLTRFGAGHFLGGAAYSPGGDKIAFFWWSPGALTVLDLATGDTLDQPCSVNFGSNAVPLAWSRNGQWIAAACGILDPNGATPAITLPTGPLLSFAWTDENHVLLASGINRRQLGIHIESFDVLTQTSVASKIDAATIEAVEMGGAFSPDGRWLAFLGFDLAESKLAMTEYLVSTAGGKAQRVLGEDEPLIAWSLDSRALIYGGGQELFRLDVSNLRKTSTASAPNEGIWRIP